MRLASYTGQFKRDVKLAQKRSKNMGKLKTIIELLLNNQTLKGENLGTCFRADLQEWYLALWSPSVQVGLLKSYELGGWPWTVVTMDIREEYMRALDVASSD